MVEIWQREGKSSAAAAMAMASRKAMLAASPYSRIIDINCHGILISSTRIRRFSSSSSSSSSETIDYPSSTNRKIKKNSFIDRLSAVIDAANDRKLPPELRGQRNNVRFRFIAFASFFLFSH